MNKKISIYSLIYFLFSQKANKIQILYNRQMWEEGYTTPNTLGYFSMDGQLGSIGNRPKCIDIGVRLCRAGPSWFPSGTSNSF